MEKHVCPVWAGYLLASSLRKLYHDPNKIIAPFVKENMFVLDVGCAMGFFSLPIAEMVKPKGKVFCVDLQKKMLDVLEKKARKKKLSDYIETINCNETTFGIEHLKNRIDFVLAFAVLHELPAQKKFFDEIYSVLKNYGRVLIAEPIGHVTEVDFEKTLNYAKEKGFTIISQQKISKSHSIILEKSY